MFFPSRETYEDPISRCFGFLEKKNTQKAHSILGRTVAVMCDESLFPVVRLQTILASLGTRNANKEKLGVLFSIPEILISQSRTIWSKSL